MLPVEGDCNATAIQWINVTLGCVCGGVYLFKDIATFVSSYSRFNFSEPQWARMEEYSQNPFLNIYS